MNYHMKKKWIISMLFVVALTACTTKNATQTDQVTMKKSVLMDKIKGGWAGQTIGVVYGAPVEFKFQGSTIQNYQPIPWGEHYVKYWWDKKPGLFDDIYNDLTFVQTFEEEGLDCSMDTLAHRFAFAEYHLAHANQASRYNIRQEIMPPASGHWLNNPHADDLDFQIEADFIGLMCPGMVNLAMDVANRVGHIMNSGDGFYGGAFVSGLYAQAFITNDVNNLLDVALKAIPEASTFHQCISDVRKWHKQYPNDWEQCFFEIHKKWNIDKGCPKGVFLSFNIDSKINCAYIAQALLYGKGDFGKTMDIATRSGQDSDCNAATVGGVLGVMLGYDAIDKYWMDPLKEIEMLNFQGIDISLSKAYDLSYKHALEMIQRNGGRVDGEEVTIVTHPIAELPLEQNFEKTTPISRERKDCFMENNEYAFDFTGNGFVVYGNLVTTQSITKDYIHRVAIRFGSEAFALAELNDNYTAKFEVWIDGKLDHVSTMPMRNTSRKLEPAWRYQLTEGVHHVELKWLNPNSNYFLRINDIIHYSENPLPSPHYMNPTVMTNVAVIDGV